MKQYSKILYLIILLVTSMPSMAIADEPIILEPLFAIPDVPPEYEDISQRSNYLMMNYWRNMDFSQKSVDQYRLNEAVYIYLVPMQWASPDITEKSIDELLKKLKKNPTLLYQFVKAMEETCYGERARISADRIYLRFLDSMLSHKKINDLRKVRYKLQRERIANSLTGNVLPEFAYTDRYGNSKRFTVPGKPAIVIFGYPDCDDCNLVTLSLSTNSGASEAVENGSIAVYYIIPDTDDDTWITAVADYPSQWEIGAASELEDMIDIRNRPSIYMLDAQGHIAAKNVSLNDALKAAKIASIISSNNN